MGNKQHGTAAAHSPKHEGGGDDLAWGTSQHGTAAAHTVLAWEMI